MSVPADCKVDHFSGKEVDQPGLESVQPGLITVQPGKEAVPDEGKYYYSPTSQSEPYTPFTPGPKADVLYEEDPQKAESRIWGMRKSIFFLALALVVLLIIGTAVGGGVGGYFAGKHDSSSNQSSALTTPVPASNIRTDTTTASIAPSTTPSPTTTSAFSNSNSTASTTDSAVFTGLPSGVTFPWGTGPPPWITMAHSSTAATTTST